MKQVPYKPLINHDCEIEAYSFSGFLLKSLSLRANTTKTTGTTDGPMIMDVWDVLLVAMLRYLLPKWKIAISMTNT